MHAPEPIHAARVAALEAALLSALRGFNQDAPTRADEVTATLTEEALDVSFFADGMPLGGFGL